MGLIPLWSAVHYFLAARTLRQDLDARYEGPKPAQPAEA